MYVYTIIGLTLNNHGFAISLPRSLGDLIAGSEFDISMGSHTVLFLRWVDILPETFWLI